ncbi:MAG: alpha/beta hydrolase [Granulosicoccus sp.]
MRTWILLFFSGLGIMSVATGCLSVGNIHTRAQPKQALDRYSLVDGTYVSEQGCRFDYRVYEPDMPVGSSSVLLGHGFLRDQDKLISLSRALANSGIRAITLNFCNMRPWNGNHEANAIDMRNLARHLDTLDDVVFGGFSAGGLAAILAADENTRAVFLLDFVDQAGLGASALKKLQVPVTGFHGPPSSCNANNSGVSTIEQHLGRQENLSIGYTMIGEASHCEFESPTDWLCKLTCADDDKAADNETTRQSIITKSVERVKRYINAYTQQNHS